MTKRKRTGQYDKWKSTGKALVTVWLSDEAVAKLDELSKILERSRTKVIEHVFTDDALLHLIGDALHAETFGAGEEQKKPEARAAVEPGSPAELARRVMERGRRKATIMATGAVVEEGRERR